MAPVCPRLRLSRKINREEGRGRERERERAKEEEKLRSEIIRKLKDLKLNETEGGLRK